MDKEAVAYTSIGRTDDSAVARDRGEIEIALEKLGNITDRLDGLSTAIRIRIEPILRPAYPREVKKDDEAREQSPLANRLQMLYDQLDCIADRLIDIEDRVAL